MGNGPANDSTLAGPVTRVAVLGSIRACAAPWGGRRSGRAGRYRDPVPPARHQTYRGLDLAAARNRTVPDVLPAPGQPFDVLFCGINPGLYSAATGHHFARPGNRFWPALHASGFTPRLLAPAEQDLLAGYGLGITNLVARATAQAAELSRAELEAGAAWLAELAARRQPRYIAIAGVTAYRDAFGRKGARVGPQAETLGGSRLWIVPNPSGLNASWTLPRITEAFRELKTALGAN
jgi:TDG/mug DNA glycosylase family protein